MDVNNQLNNLAARPPEQRNNFDIRQGRAPLPPPHMNNFQVLRRYGDQQQQQQQEQQNNFNIYNLDVDVQEEKAEKEEKEEKGEEGKESLSSSTAASSSASSSSSAAEPAARPQSTNCNILPRSQREAAAARDAPAPSCGTPTRMPWISESIRLNAPAGTRALHIVSGDALIGGTLCVQNLNVLGSDSSASIPLIVDWRDYALEIAFPSPSLLQDYALANLYHARYRRLNNGITVHVDLDVDVLNHVDTISVSLPIATASTFSRYSSGVFDWTGPEDERGITVGRLQIVGGEESLLTFYSPAFEPGRWHLCGQIEYEL